ncbi:MAG: hypothetical protein AAFP28_02740 [Pseudomonadota bacterium]
MEANLVLIRFPHPKSDITANFIEVELHLTDAVNVLERLEQALPQNNQIICGVQKMHWHK